jgi:tRNA threonylcarbamoyladenosine biosynthesis protein TsaE
MPILQANAFEFFSRSADQTRRVGMRLGSLLKRGDVVCLDGDLGAGKTTLVQGMAAGWGSIDAVSSPSYVLVNIYRRPDGDRFAHLDAYRLADDAEAIDLDLDNLIAGGPLVVEWAAKISASLPEERLSLQLSWVETEQRSVQVLAEGERHQVLLDQLRENIFKGT